MQYYQHHCGDYARDTGHLTALEHGIYRLLLDWYYINERPIPDDRAERIAKASRAEVEAILREFFFLEGSAWRHKRVERELEAMYARSETARQKAAKRWSAPKSDAAALPQHSHSNAEALPEQCNSNAVGMLPNTHYPIPITQHPKVVDVAARKRAPPTKPDDVAEQVWEDWLALRKSKRAPVTATVLESARAEAKKAGMSFEEFLRIWCSRGSQGLEASWLQKSGASKADALMAGNIAAVQRLFDGS